MSAKCQKLTHALQQFCLYSITSSARLGCFAERLRDHEFDGTVVQRMMGIIEPIAKPMSTFAGHLFYCSTRYKRHRLGTPLSR
jgi:hypothetical protein